MAKKITARPAKKKAAANQDNGDPIFIYYKGERVELKVVNSVIRRFQKLGGDFEKAEEEPLEQIILLLMAALKLTGSIEDHEDDFESILGLSPKIKLAMKRYNGGSNTPGEPIGDAPALSPVSDTD